MQLKPPPIGDQTLNPLNRFVQSWILWFQALKKKIDSLEQIHGWAFYDDSQYTSGSPLNINNTRTQLTIDTLGSFNNTTYIPSGLSWFSGNKITPTAIGDSYILRFDFTAVPSTPSDRFNLELEIAVGNIVYNQTFESTKGAGIPYIYSISIPIFCLATFVANGGKFYVDTTDNMDFYNFGLFISRVSAPNQ